MARIKLSLPEKCLFSTSLHVRVDDINYGGHLSNEVILAYCHEVRVRFLKSLGMGELDIFGKGLIMADAAVVYKAEAFQGDHLLIDRYLGDKNKYGLELYYQLTNGENKVEVARAKTGLVFYDYKTKKIATTPPEFSL